MMTTESKENVVFNPPVVTPKAYIAKSSAGWPETFERKRADADLAKFLGPLMIDDIVSMYVDSRELGEKRADRLVAWHTIVGYLSRTMGVRHDLVPVPAAIAFWAHVVMEQARRDDGGN